MLTNSPALYAVRLVPSSTEIFALMSQPPLAVSWNKKGLAKLIFFVVDDFRLVHCAFAAFCRKGRKGVKAGPRGPRGPSQE